MSESLVEAAREISGIVANQQAAATALVVATQRPNIRLPPEHDYFCCPPFLRRSAIPTKGISTRNYGVIQAFVARFMLRSI